MVPEWPLSPLEVRMVQEVVPDMAVGSLPIIPLWCITNAIKGLPHSCCHTLVISAFSGRPTALRWSTSRSRDRSCCCPGPRDTIPSSLTGVIVSWYADHVVQAVCEDLSCSASGFETACMHVNIPVTFEVQFHLTDAAGTRAKAANGPGETRGAAR